MINSNTMTIIVTRPVDTSHALFSSLDFSEPIDDIGKSDIIHSLREFTNEDLQLKDTVNNRHREQQLLHNANNKYNNEIKSIEKQIEDKRKQLTDTENTPEWIFLTTSRQYIYSVNLSFTVGGSRITANAEFKNFKDRDRLLANNFDDKVKDIIQFDINNIDEFYRDIKKRTDIFARNKLLEIKAQHAALTQEIEGYRTKLKHTEIARSSIFAIPTPTIPVVIGQSNIDVKSKADKNIAKGVESKLGSIGDSLAETFDCSFGLSCSSDLDKAAKKPNIGKELSNSEKTELGGVSSGTPDGWEPDDEDKIIPSKNNRNSGQTEQLFNSIKDAPQYPKGFKLTQNGTMKNTINNKRALEDFRKIESGSWHKVYKDGYDAVGNKVSVHYFQSQSGRVINVKVKSGWSNIK